MSTALRRTAILAVIVGLAAGVFSLPRDARGQAPSDWVPVLVTLDGSFSSQQQQAVAQYGGLVRHVFVSSPTIAIYLPRNAVEALKAYPGILNIRPEPEAFAVEDSLPWGISRTKADIVWGASSGALSVVPGRTSGSGALVAVIDSGVDKTHPDLVANLAGGYNFVRACTWCSLNTTAWNDDNGHGTHVAGIIAASDNGAGVIGVAPQARIYAVKVLNSQGSGRLGDIIAGIDHAVAAGADIINLSLGCNCNDPALKAAVDRAVAAGVLVVAAAGNAGAGTDTTIYPARFDASLSVAATCGPSATSNCSQADARAAFSSTGPSVDIAAPGDAILSTYRNGAYATLSGTSMATPHVAGVAALLVSCNPGWQAAQLRSALLTTVQDLGPAGPDNSFGQGLVVADAAVASAGCGGPPPQDLTPPQTTISSGPSGATNATSASFAFTSSEAGSTFQCQLDGSAFAACTSPAAYSGLAPGSHTFAVRATDASNNTDQTPASRAWTIDTAAPDTTITATPANPSGTSVSFSFSSTETGSTFACSLDGGAYQACTSPRSYSGLAATSHTFAVRATDPAGNTDASPASHTWTVSAPATIAMHIADLDGSRTVGWFTWDASVSVVVHDANHAPLPGAAVTIQWTGAASGTATGTTDASGKITFAAPGVPTWSGGSVTLTVTGVSKSGYTYTAAANHDPESDSNGTTITVVR